MVLIFIFRYIRKKQRFNVKSMHSFEILTFCSIKFWEDFLFYLCENFILLGAVKFFGFRCRQYNACPNKLGQFYLHCYITVIECLYRLFSPFQEW